ncbi:MAG: hypothetical protein SFY80_14940 [Verrucomicrobiota bacterium]|nr:hypothetical protein [Verrucomicrobiota bacterium]
MPIDAAIRSLLPHKPPAIWIERIVDCDGERAVCETRLPVVNEATNSGWPSTLGIEIMAQTAAVWLGINTQNKTGGAGMLVRCNKLTLHQMEIPGDAALQCTVTPVLSGDQPLHVFKGTITLDNGTLLLEGEFAILLG